jgi:hypothetical protein
VGEVYSAFRGRYACERAARTPKRFEELGMRKFTAVLVATSMLGLAGCMSGSDAGLAKSGFDADIDYQKMAVINQSARLNGHDIVWINPPTKKKSDTSNQ